MVTTQPFTQSLTFSENIEQAHSEQHHFPPLAQKIQVTFEYPVHFTNGLFQIGNPLLAKTIAPYPGNQPKPAIVVIDSAVLQKTSGLVEQIKDYADFYKLFMTMEPIVIPGGEAAKNDPALLHTLHQAMHQAKLCRHSYVVAIGGGAVLDGVGYAAATAHRGVRCVRVPTTVLAQNDSGVGVKNGINAFGQKNFLGTFTPPYAVFNDFDFLTTLDDRDWRSGIAEAVKVALVKDADFFHWIAAHADSLQQRKMTAMQPLIYQCAQLHLNHIANSGDPFERTSSRPLDFGHWAAHRLEYLTHYRLRHGEAVAIGMALDSTYSYLMGLLPQSQWQQILAMLTRLGFTLFTPELIKPLSSQIHPLFQGLTEFQEHLGGELTLMLLQGIGRGMEVHEVDLGKYQQAIDQMQSWISSIKT
jgi:3-dehydroquinate synthase